MGEGAGRTHTRPRPEWTQTQSGDDLIQLYQRRRDWPHQNQRRKQGLKYGPFDGLDQTLTVLG